MKEKIGRNDPCPCGCGRKYKNCETSKQEPKKTVLGKRKFMAKVLSAGGVHKPEPQSQEQSPAKSVVDYATLMDRAFGDSLRSYQEKPPVISDPNIYMNEENSNEEKK